MKNIAKGFPLSSRANRIAVSIAACALFFVALQPEAFGQWKLASGFNTTFGFFNYDQVEGFIPWGDSLLGHALCQTDPSGPPVPPDSLFLSTDHGQTWSDYSTGVIPIFISGTGPNAIIYANMVTPGTNNSAELLYSIDGGQTWTTDSTGLTVQGLGGGTAGSMAAIGSQIYLSDGFGVYKQTSLGGAWAPDNTGLGLGTTIALGQVGNLIASGNNLFLGTGWSGMFLSSNGGSWSAVNNGFSTSGSFGTLPALGLATSGSSIFAMTSHQIDPVFGNSADLYSLDFYRTTNNGSSWTKMNSAPINNWGSTYGFTASDQALFTATDSGFYASTDNGATWTRHNEGLPVNFTTSIQVSGGNIMIGTPTSGAYYRSASDFTGAGVAASLAAYSGLSLTLSENPAAGSEVNIIYTLPNAAAAQVMLMDELGRSVRMLQNGRTTVGQNVIALDPQSLAPGTYFVRVTADGRTAMQNLVISR